MEERYIVTPATVNAYNAGYKWEVVDTETGDAMCATPTPELAELIAKLLTDALKEKSD
jgi:hypothetical protein